MYDKMMWYEKINDPESVKIRGLIETNPSGWGGYSKIIQKIYEDLGETWETPIMVQIPFEPWYDVIHPPSKVETVDLDATALGFCSVDDPSADQSADQTLKQQESKLTTEEFMDLFCNFDSDDYDTDDSSDDGDYI